jgi:hypothetical protein
MMVVTTKYEAQLQRFCRMIWPELGITSTVLSFDLPANDDNALRSVLVAHAITRSAASQALRPPATAFASCLPAARFLRGRDRLLLLCLCGFGIGAMARKRLLVPWVALASALGDELALVAEGILQFLVSPPFEVFHCRRHINVRGVMNE